MSTTTELAGIVRLNLTGQSFGRWLVVSEAPAQGKVRRWFCRCECGTERAVQQNGLRNGSTVSCGCYSREATGVRRRTHGMTGTPTHTSWENMIGRATRPTATGHRYYFDRGITVCKHWRTFENFYADMGKRPIAHTLDRIDNNGNYSCGHCDECIVHGWPKNCRWATPAEQATNSSRNRLLTFQGRTQTLGEWAKEM